MNVGKRHRPAPNAGRSTFVLMSLIALALACFPVLAHAEDSSGVQYDDSLPELPKEKSTPTHKQTPAKSSSTDNGGGTAPSHSSGSEGSEDAGGSDESESSSKEGAAAAKGNDGGKGQGNPGGSANGGAKNAVHSGGQKATGVPTSQSSDSGGSSPLVPILIAIAVLAAISIAVVMIRQRRQGRGASSSAPSPEAN